MIKAVCCQLRKDPMRWTKKRPKDWVKETVVRSAPRCFGLEYSPMRADRSGDSIPTERPLRILPRSSS